MAPRVDHGDLAEEDTQSNYSHDDTPDEIQDFLLANGIGKKYQCIVKEHIPGGGMGVLETLNNNHPDIDEIGRRWGPGDYQLCFSWHSAKPGGGREKIMKHLDLHFPERAWREIHEDWLKERNEQRKKQQAAEIAKARQEAELKAIENGVGGAPPPPDPLETLKRALDTAKSLGIPIGGGAVKEKGLDLMAMASLLTALAPLLKDIFGGNKQNDSAILIKAMEAQQATNMMLMKSLLESRPGGGPENLHVDKILNMATGAMGRVLEMQDMMKPAEKETLVDRIFGVVDRFLPNVLELAKVSKEARERDMVYRIAAGSDEFKKARANPDVALALVNKWDEFYGFQTTNEILKVAGIERPPGTLINESKFPSDGYGPDGKRVEGSDAHGEPDANPVGATAPGDDDDGGESE